MNALFVANIDRDNLCLYSLESMRRYCEKYDLALEVVKGIRYGISTNLSYNYLTFEKNQVYDLYDRYERVLRVDSDIIITPSCPNLFDIVPEDKIGAVYEDLGSRADDRRNNQIRLVKKELGAVEGWTEGYINSGLVLAGKQHREIYRLNQDDIAKIKRCDLGFCKEQNFLNWRIRSMGCKVHDLGYQFNHMSMMSEDWNGSPDRFDSHIIHYAGNFEFPDRCGRNRPQIMQDDFDQIFE